MQNENENSKYIAIHIGNDYSYVALWENNQIKIISDEHGSTMIPTYIHFESDKVIIGQYAKDKYINFPNSTILNFKNLLGIKYSDIKDKTYSFNICSVNNDNIAISIDDTQIINIQDIYKYFINYLIDNAKKYTKKSINNIVITIPIDFNDIQKKLIKQSINHLNINNIKLINEISAIGLSKRYDLIESNISKKVLIFNIGKSNHNITILNIHNNMFEILTKSDNYLFGGTILNTRLTLYLMKKFKLNISHDINIIRKLQIISEKIKIDLSTNNTVYFNDYINNFLSLDLNNIDTEISRDAFDSSCNDLIRSFFESLVNTLQNNNINKYEIDEVITIGGTTNINLFQKYLSNYFDHITIDYNNQNSIINGATIMSAHLSGEINNIDNKQKTVLSLGIETLGGIMTNIIERGTFIPVKITQVFSTNSDNQKSCTIKVFEGERKFTKDNHKIGEFKLLNISPNPRCVPQIEVTYQIDENGIFNVTACEKSSQDVSQDLSQDLSQDVSKLIVKGESYQITLNNSNQNENQNENQNNIIKSMIEDSIENKNEDDNLLELVKLQNELNSFILQIENLFNNYGITNILPDNKIEQIKSQINSIKNNLSDVNNIKKHKDKLYELKSKINSIFN